MFFPISLLIVHFKRNHLLLLFWLLLFGFISQNIGNFYGLHYLFLAPEYLGKINYLSFAINGLMLGSFIVAYNIYSYRLNILIFPFMVTVNRPFIKYTYNNSIIPLLFIGTYIYNSVIFQKNEEFIPNEEIYLNIIGFLTGILTFIIIAYLYFLRFDRNIYKISGFTEEELSKYRSSFEKKIRKGGLKINRWERALKRIGPWKVKTYLTKPYKVAFARSSDHYSSQLIKLFFTRNHVNASYFELGAIVTFITLGLIRESEFFLIPAGASILVLFSLTLMLINSFYSFFKRWSMTIIILSIVGINFISQKIDLLYYKSYAYGIDYGALKANYDESTIHLYATDSLKYAKDKQIAFQMLNNWKKETGLSKPKLIVVNSSGGGSRSSMWTYNTLCHLDSVFNGKITKQIQFISGASGGMIGATYFRENLYQRMNNNDFYADKKHIENISKDLLNAVAYSTATSDFLPRLQSFEDNGYTYPKDRGFIFEQKLNKNLGQSLTKRLGDYRDPVYRGLAPMIIFSPTIVRENRRLLISSQPISYLTYTNDDRLLSDNIEFTRFFANHDPFGLRISSAVRLSATFPYILPTTHLPSKPEIKLIDAGGRDNQGNKITYRYLFELREWINKNTSGVIILNIRDTEKKVGKTKKLDDRSIKTNVLSPISLPYQNFFALQDFINDEIYHYIKPYFNSIDQIDFSLSDKKQVSVNFHLTKKDKEVILNDIYTEKNQASIKKLKELLK